MGKLLSPQVFTALLSLFIFSVSTLGQETRPRPRGLFIQVSTFYNPNLLNSLNTFLENVCAKNSQLPSGNTINDIVLQDVATENEDHSITMRYDVLDIVTPFLPGGSKQCFGNVFLGTVDLYRYDGNLYKEGIQDKNHTQRNINLSQEVALKFNERYPNIYHHWYVTYESNLNYLTDLKVATAYEEYLIELIPILQNIRKGAVMWSPTFWSQWNSTTDTERKNLGSNLYRLFSNVASQSPPGITWMNMQDSVGKSTPNCWPYITAYDAMDWYYFLKSIYNFASLQMNVEQFRTINYCGGIAEDFKADLEAREKIYSDHGVRMGAAFELRYWRDRLG